MKIFYFLFFITILTFLSANHSTAQVTGLSGWNIYIDPGHHGQIIGDENVGVYGYSEAHKVLRVGLALRDLLLSKTDIDTVYISRSSDQEYITLTQRTDHANALGAAWYHSIHSDAGGPTVNSTLLLYGGWRTNGQTVEKIPNGGKEMSDIIVNILTRGYRTNTSGTFADRYFYERVDNHTQKYPYLHVNRETTMPSELSEAGFHTNPVQNQRNMSEKWKRLEAYTLYWSILEFFEIDRPFVGISTGIISDIESSLPINGAIVSLDGHVDTTDTYESLFHLYSNDPNQLRNGFYFFEGLPPGNYPITVQAEGFDPYAGEVTIEDTFFTFKDIQLVSNISPSISSISPEQNDSIYPSIENIRIIFSRPMNKASVEASLTISPSTQINFIWSDGDRRLAITTDNFSFNTNYQLVISGNALDKYNHHFDGDGNGVGGDDFVLNFKTKAQDFAPPVISDIYPAANEMGVDLKPIINLSFNEQVNTSTLSGKVKLIKDSDQSSVTGILKHYIVDRKSVVNLFVTSGLSSNERYTVRLESGLKDIFGNEITTEFTSGFTTGDQQFVALSNIDNFESGTGTWWAPQQSGSTEGIITELTNISSATNYFNYIAGGSKSMKLTYGWDTLATDWLIREYYSPTIPSFSNSYILQTYLFGDGTGTKFRFAVRDGTDTIEVSPWYSLDWIGWKLVNWDMLNDGTGTWIGNGILDNPLRYDSYQLTFEPGNDNTGEIYFDDLRVVNKTTVGVGDEIASHIPLVYSLEQNYPNPFNPETNIKFTLPNVGTQHAVSLRIYDILGNVVATLVNEEKPAGTYEVTFSAKGGSASALSSGIYFYQLKAGNYYEVKKMILMK